MGRAGVLRVAGHAAVARVGEGVVVLVHHGEARAPVEVICCEAVLQRSQAGIELSILALPTQTAMSSLSANKSLPPNIWYLAREWGPRWWYGGYTCTCTPHPPSVSIANMFIVYGGNLQHKTVRRRLFNIYANLWNIYSKKSSGGATRNNPNEWSLVT